MSMTVKAYLQKEGKDDEIRRFAVDQQVSSSYEYLSKKISQVFPSLTGVYRTFWKDSENDLIAFSSDEELCEALGFVNDGVFRIYIKEVTVAGGSEGGSEPEHHPGVVCDGCEKGIYGIRYKCIVCPDFDLCSGCQGQGLHREHELLRIARPGQMPFFGLGGFGGFVPPPPPPPPFGPCHPPPPFGGPPGHQGGRGGPWRQWMDRNVRRWMDHFKNQTQASAEGGKDKDGKEQEKSGEIKPEKMEDGDNVNPAEDYLRCVGDSVAAMLDPLGIDVEVDVEHQGQRQHCRGRPGRGCHGNRPGWRHWGSGTCGPRGGEAATGNSAQEEKKDTRPENVQTPEAAANDVEMAATTAETPPEAQKEGDSAKPAASGTADDPAATTEGAKSEHSPSPDGGWTIIQENSPHGGSAARIYPEVPADPTHTNPRIVQALDHMAAMGFTDEGGWLTRLLEVSNGDINKALDAIRANRHN